jgi:hypothetical protein
VVDTAADQLAGYRSRRICRNKTPVIGQVTDARGEAKAQQMTEGKDVIGNAMLPNSVRMVTS